MTTFPGWRALLPTLQLSTLGLLRHCLDLVFFGGYSDVQATIPGVVGPLDPYLGLLDGVERPGMAPAPVRTALGRHPKHTSYPTTATCAKKHQLK